MMIVLKSWRIRLNSVLENESYESDQVRVEKGSRCMKLGRGRRSVNLVLLGAFGDIERHKCDKVEVKRGRGYLKLVSQRGRRSLNAVL